MADQGGRSPAWSSGSGSATGCFRSRRVGRGFRERGSNGSGRAHVCLPVNSTGSCHPAAAMVRMSASTWKTAHPATFIQGSCLRCSHPLHCIRSQSPASDSARQCAGFTDTVQRIRSGTPYPFQIGKLPKERISRTPTRQLNLQPGEWIRVRSYESEIRGTITEAGLNRGMLLAEELVPYCGKTFRVGERVSRMLDERSGKMVVLKNECIALDGVRLQRELLAISQMLSPEHSAVLEGNLAGTCRGTRSKRSAR